MDFETLRDLGVLLTGVGSGILALWRFYEMVQDRIKRPLLEVIAANELRHAQEMQIVRQELRECHEDREKMAEKVFNRVMAHWDGRERRGGERRQKGEDE